MNVSKFYGMPCEGYFKSFLAGVECEIEGVREVPSPLPGFTVTTDGSLRSKRGPGGHGYEFVSSPSTREHLLARFAYLHTHLKYWPDEDPFSSRTSTHVHINCIPLELVHVRNMVLLYALYEELFFKMVKPERRDNIHCVPLDETTLSRSYSKPLELMQKGWHKYTALNLGRLPDLGTVEFRHMHGTSNVEEMDTWIRTLENLWHLCQEVVIDQKALTNEDTLYRWFSRIFADAPILKYQPSLFPIIQNSLLDVKLSLI